MSLLSGQLPCLLLLALFNLSCYAGGEDSGADNAFSYKATFVAKKLSLGNSVSQITFRGRDIISSDSSVINELEECTFSQNHFRIVSSYRWLDLEVNFKTGKFSTTNIDNQALNFLYPLSLFGNDVKVVGAKVVPEAITILYISESKGILGFGLLGDYAGLGDKYYSPIYWLEGSLGLCHRS